MFECKGVSCPFYRKFYDVTKLSGGGFAPNFSMTEERCQHPDMLATMTTEKVVDRIGVRIMSIKQCPIK
jgi:hypothetical protein